MYTLGLLFNWLHNYCYNYITLGNLQGSQLSRFDRESRFGCLSHGLTEKLWDSSFSHNIEKFSLFMPLVCVDVVRSQGNKKAIKNQVFLRLLARTVRTSAPVQQSSRGAPYKRAVQCAHAASFCMLRCHRKICPRKFCRGDTNLG